MNVSDLWFQKIIFPHSINHELSNLPELHATRKVSQASLVSKPINLPKTIAMKRIRNLTLCLCATLLPGIIPVNAQGTNEKEVLAIDLKMDLAETKLELLDSKIRLWEDKPAALEIKLRDIEQQINQLSFTPEQFDEKFLLLDSMLMAQQLLMDEQLDLYARLNEEMDHYSISPGPQADPDQIGTPDLQVVPPSKYVISIYPIRIFEGTMQLSVERVLNRGNAIELSAMATYATREGIANYYLSNQKLEYYNAAMDSYVPYESENISGFGTSLAWRNYLLPRTKPHYSAPRGAYAAPMVMYRRLSLSGFDYVFNEETEITDRVEVEQYLNVFTGGIMAGWQFVLWNAITADLYVGGIVRLSKYDGDAHFTKYKQIRNIDFSGVMPTFGLKIGINK